MHRGCQPWRDEAEMGRNIWPVVFIYFVEMDRAVWGFKLEN